MKIELKKVNDPDGGHWYGIWIDGSCQIPAFGENLEAAQAAYERIKEAQKTPLPKYEIIKEEEI